MMHLLKLLSIRNLTYLMFGGFVLLAIVNFVVFRRYDNRISDNIAAQNALSKSWNRAMNLVNLSEDIIKGKESAPELLKESLKNEENLITVLSEGGLLSSHKRINQLGDSSSTKVEALRKIWNQFKPHFSILLYGSNGGNNVTGDSLTLLSPSSSLRFIQLNHSDIVTARHQLYESLQTEYTTLQKSQFYVLIFFLVFTIAAIVFALIMVVKHLFNPLDNVYKVVDKINSGNLNIAIQADGKNEIGLISKSLNELTQSLRNASEYVKNIGNGTADSSLLENGEKEIDSNSLQGALIEMNDKLISVAQEEKERNWETEGMAKFVNILRSTDSDVKDLSTKIISGLVDYTNSNQGGIYLLNENLDEPQLELTALYAFDSNKFEKKQIRLGEGLVGQTFMEKKTTYLAEVPHDYISIVSGLGGANPKAILVVPMMVNDRIFGVIEVASFNDYAPYQIDFIEKLGESIASTIESVKNNERTKHLLEQSQEMTEQLRAQEEEMRQNMEELSATQEEVSRRAEESDKLLAQSKEKTKYQEILYEISRDYSSNLDDLLQKSMDIICEKMFWPLAHAYFVSDTADGIELLPTEKWCKNAQSGFKKFKEITSKTSFKTSVGLPGRVHESKKAHWIDDVTKDQNFPRLEAAREMGLKSAFAFPVAQDKKVVAVVEFFSIKVEEYGVQLIEFMDNLGELIGFKSETTKTLVQQDPLDDMLKLQLEELQVTQEQLAIKLNESENVIELSNSYINLIITNESGNLTFANEKAKETFGFDETRTLTSIFPEYDTNELSDEEKTTNHELKLFDGSMISASIKHGTNGKIYISWI